MQQLQEISVQDLAELIKANHPFTILDVREEWELIYAKLIDKRVVHLPMSRISRELINAFPEELRGQETEMVVMCHHGVRSANVAIWMTQNGWRNVSSLAGGIDAYSSEIDPAVGSY